MSESEKLRERLAALREQLAQVARDFEQASIAALDGDLKAREKLAVLIIDREMLPFQIAELERRARDAELDELRQAYAAATADLADLGKALGPLVGEYRAVESERRILMARLGPSAAEVLPLSERMQALQAQMGPIRTRQADAERRADVAVNKARKFGVELR